MYLMLTKIKILHRKRPAGHRPKSVEWPEIVALVCPAPNVWPEISAGLTRERVKCVRENAL